MEARKDKEEHGDSRKEEKGSGKSAELDEYAEFKKTDERLHKEINQYYHDNKDTFKELVSVTFANRSTWIELVYIEGQRRSEEEMQGYEEDLIEKAEQTNSHLPEDQRK